MTFIAIQAASEEGRAKVLGLLLDKRAEIDSIAIGKTMRMASAGGRWEVVKLLLDRGADITREVMKAALEKTSQRRYTEVYNCS